MTCLDPYTDLVFAPSRESVTDGHCVVHSGGESEPCGAWSVETARTLVGVVANPNADWTALDLGGGGWPFLCAGWREQRKAAEAPALRPAVTWRRYPLTARDRSGLGSAVAITGGLGGIGLFLGEQFSRWHLPVILVDTASLSDLSPARAAAVARVARMGRVVVCTPSELGRAAATLGPIEHLVACAGRLTLASARSWSADALAQYARHKADAFAAAASQLLPHGLRTVVVFGSSEARNPHRQFGAYALANELVRDEANAFRARHGVQVIVAEWAMWHTIGMAAGFAAYASRAGFAAVEPHWGFEATASLLAERVDYPRELVLGGASATPRTVTTAVFGVGGNTLLPGLDGARQLATLCDRAISDGQTPPVEPHRGGRWAVSSPSGVTYSNSPDDPVLMQADLPWPGTM